MLSNNYCFELIIKNYYSVKYDNPLFSKVLLFRSIHKPMFTFKIEHR